MGDDQPPAEAPPAPAEGEVAPEEAPADGEAKEGVEITPPCKGSKSKIAAGIVVVFALDTTACPDLHTCASVETVFVVLSHADQRIF